MKNFKNYLKITLPAISANEALSRAIISSFATQLDPTIEEICDLKTAISEAVTNCIVHAYINEKNENNKLIYISASYSKDGLITVKIRDKGCGISDIDKALQPMYSGSGNSERSGMGFSIMKCFTDKFKVKSQIGKGTTVILKKYISTQNDSEN